MNVTGPRFLLSKLSSPILSISCLRALILVTLAAPVLAQGQRSVSASGYGTGESIEISGWEKDLVRRNKGLEKFHWSAINTVQRYRAVSTIVGQKSTSEKSVYLASKPRVISHWSNTSGQTTDKVGLAAVGSSKNKINGQFVGANPGAYWSIGQGYETKPCSYKAMPNNGDRQVSAKVLQY